MKVALCYKRVLPPGRKQDGFQILPPEAIYDKVAEVEITDDETEVIEKNGEFFVRIFWDEKWGGTLPIFLKSKYELIA